MCLDAEPWCRSTGLCLTAKTEPSGFVGDQHPVRELLLDAAVVEPDTDGHEYDGRGWCGFTVNA